MAIIASKGEGQTFVPAPAGVSQGVCVDAVDRGIVEVTWNGQTKRQHKVDVVWQIDETREDGKPYLVRKRYTLSLSEKATLRKDLESWRGRAFTREEEMGFDLEKLLGVNCLLNIQHVTRGDKTYANVVSVMPLLKSMDKIHVRDYVRVQDRPAVNGTGDVAQAQSDEPPTPSDEEMGQYIDDVPF
jgi:hypothetical protein